MRRTFALLTGLGLLGAALGCQHIGGKNDCGAHPSDAVISAPTNPYPYALAGTAVVPKKVGNETSALPEAGQLPEFKPVTPDQN